MIRAIIALMLLIPAAGYAETLTVFRGRPLIRVRENAVERKLEKFEAGEAAKKECVITRVGENYYWASRGNAPLTLTDDWGYMTFVAVGGVGFIRIIKPAGKEIASQLGATERDFDYVEHTIMGLSGVSTYGIIKK